jgi:hypothetical protein
MAKSSDLDRGEEEEAENRDFRVERSPSGVSGG